MTSKRSLGVALVLLLTSSSALADHEGPYREGEEKNINMNVGWCVTEDAALDAFSTLPRYDEMAKVIGESNDCFVSSPGIVIVKDQFLEDAVDYEGNAWRVIFTTKMDDGSPAFIFTMGEGTKFIPTDDNE